MANQSLDLAFSSITTNPDELWREVRRTALARSEGDEDFAQDVTLAVFEGLAGFDGRSPFSHWLRSLISRMNNDRAALAAYCAAWSRWISAEQSISKFGAVIKSPKSNFPIQNPYVGIANTAMDQMRKFLVEFGMTPSSRSRLNIDTTPPADSFESFMAGIGADDIVAPEEITQSDGAP